MISYSTFISQILPFTLKSELGYSNVASDKGGETYRGITRKNFPSWAGWSVVDAKKPLKRGQIIPELETPVKEFYWKYFTDRSFENLNSVKVALALFDFAVNGGYSASKFKTMINSQFNKKLNTNGGLSSSDFFIVNGLNQDELTKAVMQMRTDHYINIIQKDPSQAVNAKGWTNRMNSLYSVLGVVKNNPITTILIMLAVAVLAYFIFIRAKVNPA